MFNRSENRRDQISLKSITTERDSPDTHSQEPTLSARIRGYPAEIGSTRRSSFPSENAWGAGFPWRQIVEQFHEARLVRITHGGFAIWLNPFGMLHPQVVVNLLPKLGVGVDLVSHRHCLGERFKCAAERFLQSLAGIVDLR